jgi:hypothetical protein
LLAVEIWPPQGIYEVPHGEIDHLYGSILSFADSLVENSPCRLLAGHVFERFGFVHPLAIGAAQAVADTKNEPATGSDGIRNVTLLVRLTSQLLSFRFDPSLPLMM